MRGGWHLIEPQRKSPDPILLGGEAGKGLKESTTMIHDTEKNTAPDSQFITIELRGGPHHGQTMRVPSDEFYLTLRDRGRSVVYSRFNDRPIFHAEDAIVALLGGRS